MSVSSLLMKSHQFLDVWLPQKRWQLYELQASTRRNMMAQPACFILMTLASHNTKRPPSLVTEQLSIAIYLSVLLQSHLASSSSSSSSPSSYFPAPTSASIPHLLNLNHPANPPGSTALVSAGGYTYFSGMSQLRKSHDMIERSTSKYRYGSRQLGIVLLSAGFVSAGIYRMVN